MLNAIKNLVSPEKPKETYPFKFRDKLSKDWYDYLRARIKGKAAMGRGLREEACANRGDVRWYLRKMKRDQAWDVRVDLLFLNMLKGRRYKDVEPTSDPDCRPDASNLKRLGWMLNRTYTEQKLDDDLEYFFKEEE